MAIVGLGPHSVDDNTTLTIVDIPIFVPRSLSHKWMLEELVHINPSTARNKSR